MSQAPTALFVGLVITLQMLLTSCQQPKALSEDTFASPQPLPSGWIPVYKVPPSELQRILQPPKKELLYGYIDKTGQFVIPPKFKQAVCFRGGLAPVTTEAGQSYIDKTGRFLTKPGEYITVHGGSCEDTWPDFSEGLHRVEKEVRPQGNAKSSSDSETISYTGYVNNQGKLVIPLANYGFAKNFSNGMAKFGIYVKTDPLEIAEAKQRNAEDARERYGYMDTTGKVVIPPKFNYAQDFRWGIAKVGIKHLVPDPNPHHSVKVKAVIYYGFIDKQGRYLVEPTQNPEIDEYNCRGVDKLIKRSQELMGKDALTKDSQAIKQLCGKGERLDHARDGFVKVDNDLPPSSYSEYLNELLVKHRSDVLAQQMKTALQEDLSDPDYLSDLESWDVVAGDDIDA